MEPREFEIIDQFLKVTEKGDLFEYYAVAADSGDDVLEEVVKKRRAWAQGQQSNPKFRNEALWIIKNMALVRRAMIEERPAYLEEVARRASLRNLEKLSVFIEGSLADGVLNPAKENAIHEQGQKLGLQRAMVAERIQTVLAKLKAPRTSESNEPAPDSFVDWYQLLRVPADADASVIEEAHRARYREARDMGDKSKASTMYGQLDEAWRVLKDAERRADYDRRRRDYMILLERRAAGEDVEFKGFLPPPPKKRPGPEPITHARLDPEPTTESDEPEVLLTQAARVVHEAPPARPAAPPPRPPATRTSPQSTPPAPAPQAPASPVSAYTTGPVQPHPSSMVAAPTPPAQPRPITEDPLKGASGGAFNPARNRQKAPQLEIDGPEVHKVVASGEPVTVQFVVRNAGQGQMSGRVLSDREWVQVVPARLDPLKREQVVEARVLPRQMPRRQAISLVTVVADHGERRSVTIDVERRAALSPAAIGALAIVGLVLLGMLLSLVLS